MEGTDHQSMKVYTGHDIVEGTDHQSMKVYTGQVPFHMIVCEGTVIKKVPEGSQPPHPADTSLISSYHLHHVIPGCYQPTS